MAYWATPLTTCLMERSLAAQLPWPVTERAVAAMVLVVRADTAALITGGGTSRGEEGEEEGRGGDLGRDRAGLAEVDIEAGETMATTKVTAMIPLGVRVEI